MDDAADEVDPKLLEMMVCPVTKTRLEWSSNKRELISFAARIAFPVRNGVPLLILDEARSLDDNETPHG